MRERPDYYTVEEWNEYLRKLAARKDDPKPVKKSNGWISEENGFVRTEDGTILKGNPKNIVHAVVNNLGIKLRDNGFSNQTQAWSDYMDWKNGTEFTDKDANRLRLLIHEKFGFLPPRQLFEDVIMDIAYQNSFHPVRDYLDARTWDGVPRIDNWLHDYGGAEDTPFNRAVGRIFLIAAVRRVRSPGCKFDTMLVFESPMQGRNKSQAARILATREEWFNDNLPIGAKPQEVIEQIRGSWIIEFPELAGISSREIEHIKAFLSRQVDKARPAYGRRLESIPRQFVAIGTTNDEEYLKNDERRFWPVRIDRFDIERLAADVGQLWAEAAHYEAEGESIVLQEDLWPAASEARAARTFENPWQTKLNENFCNSSLVTSEMMWESLGVPRDQRGKHFREVGRAMKNIGFAKRKCGRDSEVLGLKRGDWFYERI